jgi:hypothetical protein
MLSRSDIEAILYYETERTRELAEKAWRHFHEVVSDVQRLPSPEGAQRIVDARRLETEAQQNHATALREFSRFILKGEIPARLRGDGEVPPKG